MSVINRMLQDLDRRQALGGAAEATVVRTSVVTKPGGREWFWRVLVVLLIAALARMGWVAIQLLPRKPLATELAFQAAAQAQRRAAVKPAAPPAAPAAPAAVAATPAVEESKPAAAASSDALRLAVTLETPVREKELEPVKAQPVSRLRPRPRSRRRRPRRRPRRRESTSASAPGRPPTTPKLISGARRCC